MPNKLKVVVELTDAQADALSIAVVDKLLASAEQDPVLLRAYTALDKGLRESLRENLNGTPPDNAARENPSSSAPGRRSSKA